MAGLKPGQIDITPGGGKRYKTLWRPDGQPVDINITDINNHPDVLLRIKNLLFRGYTEDKPAKVKAKAKAK